MFSSALVSDSPAGSLTGTEAACGSAGADVSACPVVGAVFAACTAGSLAGGAPTDVSPVNGFLYALTWVITSSAEGL